jgi:hypothetical protein
MLGVVLEGRLQDVAHSGLEISFTRFGEFPPKTQLGAVCEVCENMTVNAAPLAKFQTPAARPPEGAQDGLSPAAHVGPVEKQVGRCGARVEVEVVRVQTEVRGRLEARQEASGPSFAPIEGAAGVVSAAVGEIVGRVMGPAGNVLGGGGERLSCGLELVEVGAGGVPVAGRPGRGHGLSGGRRMVDCAHRLPAGIDPCSSYRLEHFYVPNSKKATKNLSFVYRGEVLVVAPLVLYCSGEMSVKQETRP